METGRPNKSNEAKRVANSRDNLPELIKIIGLIFKLPQFLDLIVKMLRPFIGVEARIIIFISILLEPLPLAVQHILDILHEEELTEGSHLATSDISYVIMNL